jgi:RNA polymerase sigma-70 factor, ECF subfamily
MLCAHYRVWIRSGKVIFVTGINWRLETGAPLQSLARPDPSDEALAARVARHDMAAFSLIYDRYAQSVYALAAHLLGPIDAEEIVQEVFLRLWNKAEQFDESRGNFGGWFMTVARNYVMDELRSRSQQQKLVAAEEIDHLLSSETDPSVNVEEESSQREQGAAIFRALKTLPEEQRRVLILAYFGGLSQSAIAERLNWPLGTVKKRIRLGLQKLRAFLTGHEAKIETKTSAE